MAASRMHSMQRVVVAIVVALVVALLCAQASAASSSPKTAPSEQVRTVSCDVIVAGGSLASLAAAVSAANASASVQVCFLEITDWPGGQLTASAVPAVDFGPSNRVPMNLPASFNELLFGPLMPDHENLGNCWVSYKCFTPPPVVHEFVFPLLARFSSNLQTFLRTAVSYVVLADDGASIKTVRAIQRTPKRGTGWEKLTSAQLDDWYSSSSSDDFDKTLIDFQLNPNGVVIDATEFGDVLSTGGYQFAQGVESPNEDSDTSAMSYCGQSATIPFFVTYHEQPVPSPDPWPAGSAEGLPWRQQGFSWDKDWTYRRVDAAPNSDKNRGRRGETSVINVGGGNDFSNGYIFLPADSDELKQQLATPGAWRGGVNLTSYALAEQRAYGFYHWFLANGSAAEPYLAMNASLAGTQTGLSKMPYLRDNRRSVGIKGFRMFLQDLTTPDPDDGRIAVEPFDSIAIGQYWFADIHKMAKTFCDYPDYLVGNVKVLPYFIPFRALTVDGAPNLLVAGKSIASSFYANAALRLHPEEWSTGVAAGVSAALMSAHGWKSTGEAMMNVHLIREQLKSMGSPLEWTF